MIIIIKQVKILVKFFISRFVILFFLCDREGRNELDGISSDLEPIIQDLDSLAMSAGHRGQGFNPQVKKCTYSAREETVDYTGTHSKFFKTLPLIGLPKSFGGPL